MDSVSIASDLPGSVMLKNPDYPLPVSSTPKHHRPVSCSPSAPSSLFEDLKPLLWLMRVFGLFHSQKWIESDDDSKAPCCRSKVYSAIVVATLWICFIIYFFGYKSSDFAQLSTDVAIGLFPHIFSFIAAFQSTFMLITCNDPKKLKLLCAQWRQQQQQLSNKTELPKNFYRIRNMAISSSLTAVMITGLFFLIGMFSSPELFLIYEKGFGPLSQLMPGKYDILFKLIMYVVNVYQSAAFAFPIAFYLFTLQLFRYKLRSFNEKVKNGLKEDGTFSVSIQIIREEFLENCVFIRILDSVFRHLVGSTLLCLVIMGCLMIFSISTLGFTELKTYVLMSLVLCGGGFVVIIALVAGGVRDEAYECKETLLQIRNPDYSKKEYIQMALLLEKLNENSIGITAFGLITIDNSSAITFFGLIASYTILIREINKDAGSPNTSCNCDCLTSFTKANST